MQVLPKRIHFNGRTIEPLMTDHGLKKKRRNIFLIYFAAIYNTAEGKYVQIANYIRQRC